jgi:hypothetical protein
VIEALQGQLVGGDRGHDRFPRIVAAPFAVLGATFAN